MNLFYTPCYLTILVTYAQALPRSYLGSNCDFHGAPALCKALDDCPQASEKHGPNVTRCGFTDNDVEMVCCPNSQAEMTPLTIANGEDAKEKEFPHMTALAFVKSDGTTYDCGGTLISERYVLTAAHCFIYETTPSRVRLGITKLSDPEHLDVAIKNFTIHDNYTTKLKYHDIALIELADSVEFSDRIKPACPYEHSDDPENLQITGWGETLNEPRSDVLQKASVQIISSKECQEIINNSSFDNFDPTIQVCAIGDHKDSCRGDSGGPLQLKSEGGEYEIVGIVSHGPEGCSGNHNYSIYTKVSFYVEWIRGIINETNIC